MPQGPGRHDVGAPPYVEVAEHHAYLSLMLQLGGHEGTDFDVLHNNSLHYLPVAMARSLPMPVLTTLHTPPLWWLESAVQMDGGSSSFAAVSRHTAASWAPITESTVVLNGVDVDQWPAGPGGPIAVWSGRIVEEKAPHHAILAARRAGTPIVLAGPILDLDYFREHVEPLLGPGATYAGHLPQASSPPWWAGPGSRWSRPRGTSPTAWSLPRHCRAGHLSPRTPAAACPRC